MSNALLAVDLTALYDLKGPMVSALMTGKNELGEDTPIQAGPRSIKALVDRRLVSDTTGCLTELGQIFYRVFSGMEVSDGEVEIARSSAPESSASRPPRVPYVVVLDSPTLEGMIRLASEGEEGVSLGDAKNQIRDHLRTEIKTLRAMLKQVGSIRKSDIVTRGDSHATSQNGYSHDDSESEDETQTEALFSDAS